jgi:pyridoxal phosphate enzyme (YggS family)
MDMPMDATGGRDLAERFARARRRIERAGGDPERITLVAVTKGFGPEVVAEARALGHVDFGENYTVDLVRKAEAVAVPPGAEGVRWHYLGAVQRTTARKLGTLVDLWQGVDGLGAGERIAQAAPGARLLVQVNVSGELRKQGCTFDAAPGLVESLRGLGLDVRGLMAVGPAGPPEAARAGFRRLAELADALGLSERSMGMSGDLEVAVAEGATMVRLGTALFGPRPPHP